MTDPIASASIFIRPDTTGFRALLEAEIRKATLKPITIPVVAAPVAGGVTGSIAKATAATTGLATASKKQAAAATQSAAATIGQAKGMGQLQRGAASTVLSMGGIRGATLAASGAFLAGAAAITVFAKAVGSVVSLQQQLAVFAVTTGATAGEMQNVSAAAKQMGQDLTLPGISAGDAATAMTELAKAGLSVQDAIDGARGVLQLAIAANISFADATQLAASALNAFGLEGADAIKVADVLANAANAAQGSIGDMGLALQQAAAVGRQVGLSLESTTTFLTQLAREGIRGSDAGTSLRVTLGRLINPTKKIEQEMDKLGVSLRDAAGNIRPDFFVNLGIAMKGMSKAQKDATLAIIGGMDGMRALSILTRQNITDTLGLSDQLRQQGTAADQAKARMTGLTGAASNLSNTLQGIGMSIGRSVTPALTGLTTGLTAVAGTLASVFGALNRAIGVGAIIAAVAAFKLLPPVIAATTAAFRGLTLATIASSLAMVESAGVAATARIALTAMLGAINLPALAAGVAIGGLIVLLTRFKSSADQARAASDKLLRSMETLASATDAVKTAQSNLTGQNLAVTQAKINVVVAKQALALSTAAKGSVQYAQLQNNVAVALNQVEVAQQELATTQDRLTLSQEQLTIEQEKNADALAENEDKINSLIAHYALITGSAQAFKDSLNDSTTALFEQADAHRKEATEFSIDLGKREAALAALQVRLNRFATPTEVHLIMNTDSLERGLQRVEEDLIATGERGGKGFADKIMFSLTATSDDFVNFIDSGLGPNVINAFGLLGQNSAAAFGQNLIAFVQGTINTILSMINGAAQAAGAVTTTIGQRIGLAEAAGDTGEALRLARAKVTMFERIKAQAAANKDQKTFSEATDKLIDAQNEANSLEQQLANDAKAGAKATASAAKSAQDARDKADQAVQDLFARKEAKIEIKLAVAENTKGLMDDIRAQVALRNALIRQIAIFKREIKDEELRRQVIQELRLKIAQTRGAIQDLFEERNKNRAAAKKARDERKKEQRDERLEGMRLNVQIAQARENIAGERRARERLIKGLIEARKLTVKGTNAYRKLTLEIENEKKALRELLKETEDRGRIAKSLQFEFLQQQQGFAANLLGNLIPAAAIANNPPPFPGGALGGGTTKIKPPAAPGVGQGAALGAGLGAAGAPRGTTQAQTGTMIELLRGILRTLRKQARDAAVPEAQYERSKGSARGDSIA